MKANVTMLYPNEKAAIRVTDYAEAQSGKLPETLRKYHDWILTQEKANITISKFQAQALMWIARTANVKRGTPELAPLGALPPLICTD